VLLALHVTWYEDVALILFYNQHGKRVAGLLLSRAQTILAHQLTRMSGFAKPVQLVGNHQQRVVQ
jgi:hypothetical protein